MKKYKIACLAMLLAGCSGLIKPEAGSEMLVAIDAEPIGCLFLYKLEAETSVYDQRDAEQYLRNRIIDQQRRGNVYWIVSQRTRPNEGAVFGPERSFVMTANVYDCPNARNVFTKKNSDVVESYYEDPNTRGVFGGLVKNPVFINFFGG